MRYYRLAKLSSSEKCSRTALAGVISCSRLAASAVMLGFYIAMCRKTRALIGGKAFLYLVTLFTTVFLIVWSAAVTFTSPLPNIIAQLVNSLGYAAFIAVNGLVIRKLKTA